MTLSEIAKAYMDSANKLEVRIAAMKDSGESAEEIAQLEALCDEARQVAQSMMSYAERKGDES